MIRRSQIYIDTDFKDMLKLEAERLGMGCAEDVLEKLVNDYFLTNPEVADRLAEKVKADSEERLKRIRAMRIEQNGEASV